MVIAPALRHTRSMNMQTSQNANLYQRIFAEQIEKLYSHAMIVLGGGSFIAAMTVLLLWSPGIQFSLTLWLILQAFFSLLRAALAFQFRRLLRAGEIENYRRWAWAWTFGSLLTGFVWAALPWLVMDLHNLSNALIISLILFAMVPASIGSNTYFFPSFLCFSIPVGLLLSLRFIAEGGSMIGIGGLIGFFILVNSIFAYRLSILIKDGIARGFEREMLLVTVQKKREEAEKASNEKSRFLAAVSHDLRQPLHALDLFHASLQSRISNADQLQLLQLARSSSHSLGEMLGELMDIARFDAGKIQSHVKMLPLAPLLADCVEELRPQAEEKGLKLRLRLPRKGCVQTDPVLFKRILRNLLSNAIRHTESGGVLVGTRIRRDVMRIEVHDTGSGIGAEALPHIFDEFYQVNNPERNREKGLGLGLAIVRRVAEILDHPVEVKTRLGIGSCFCVSAPLCAVAAQCDVESIRPVVDETDLTGLFVIVVDDDKAILQGMRRLLLDWGCEVLLAEGKDDLMEELGAHGYPPSDIMICDYRLRGGETGLDVVAAVRGHFDRLDLPAAVVSGDVHPEVQQMAKQMGCHWLEKPVQEGALRRMLAEMTEVRN